MSSTPISLPTKANRRHEPSFDLPSLPQELRLMIWKASMFPRVVPLMVNVETPECKHILRRVRSNAIVTARCEGRQTTKNTHFSKPPVPVANNPCTFPDTQEDVKLDRIIHEARTSIIHDWRYKPRFAWESNLPPPPLLHACKESREFALKHYTLSFATKHSCSTTYFNFQLDTLYFTQGDAARDATYLKCFQRGSWPLLGCISPSEQLQIRNLAIDTRILKLWEESTPHLQRTLSQIQKSYRKVEIVYVVVADFTQLYDGRRPGCYSKADSLTLLPEDNIPLKLYSYTNPHWHKNHPAGETTEPLGSVAQPETRDDPDGIVHAHSNIPPKLIFRRMDVFWHSTELESTSSSSIQPKGSSKGNLGSLEYIPLPDVEYRVLSTQHMKMRLERLQREYEEENGSCQCYEGENESPHEPRNELGDTYVIWKSL